MDDRPDCYVDYPQHSVILEVKAAELIKSEAFGAEKTLRFPRVVKIRYDKDWNEGLNFEDLQEFINNESTKGIKKRERKSDVSENESDKETLVAYTGTKKVRK